MTQETITADEYRIAAKVADAEGDTDLSAILKQRAIHVAAQDAYTNELVQSVLDTWLTVEGATSLSWWTTQVTGITRTVLAKLDADGRLVPNGGRALTAQEWSGWRENVVAWKERADTASGSAAEAWGAGFDAGFEYAGNQSGPTGIFRDPPLNPYEPETYTAKPVDRCRCGVLEDEPSDGCESHAAAAEKAAPPLQLPIKVGSRIRGSARRWSAALEWAPTNPYVDTFVLDERGYWCAENDELAIVPGQLEYLDVVEILHVGPESWATWKDVPENVWFTSRDYPDRPTYRRNGISVYRLDHSWVDLTRTDLDSLAPFVAIVRAEAGEQA